MANFVFINNDHLRPAQGTRVLKAAEYAVAHEADQLLAAARRRAANIIAAAEKLFQAEKERGYQTGLEEARQQTAGQIADATTQIEQHFQELEAQSVQLVMAILKKVMQDIDPTELVTAQVKKALSRFKGRKRVVVKVHSSRADMLHDALSRIMADTPAMDLVEIKPAANLAEDQLILESDTGIVDATMSKQLTSIEAALSDELQ